MKIFDSVVIACDHTPEMFQTAKALQGVLEDFGLRVHFYHLVQKPHALDFFAQKFPDCEYVVLCCHGGGGNDDMKITLRVVDQVDGKYDEVGGWSDVVFSLTPANVSQHVKNAEATLISIACGSGRPAFGEAFLKAGYKA